jgi:CO/xanthine dehydrogenase Mo-binding subunit/CO/xanthine dehydrogenase FAD-binding subunit
MSEIGRSVRPIGWQAITSGTYAYSSDLTPEGLLQGRVLRSPHPHARIVSIDTTQAKAMPGVRAIVTGADFPAGVFYPNEGSQDREPIAQERVRFIGQEVAAIAAETIEQADAALAAIEVIYEILPAPFTLDEASAANAPELHKRPTNDANVARNYKRLWGDIAAARKAGPLSVDGVYWYPQQSHVCMESNNTLAQWDEDGKRLHVWTGTSAPQLMVEELAVLLGIEEHAIICHEAGVGGSFGSKSRISEQEVVAAILAKVAKAPVLVSLTRREEFATTKTRHGFRSSLRIHADEQGHMHGIEGKIAVDNGAFVHSGYSVTGAALKGLGTMYRLSGFDLDAQLIDTSKQPGGQFRGYGSTQAMYALECLIDDLAGELKIDPIDLRKRNANLPYTTAATGSQIQSARLAECLDAVRVAIDWDNKKTHPRPGRGVGVACGLHSSGSYGPEGSNRADNAIDIFPDGRVLVRFGGADTGTGQKTILAQIAAEELGLKAEDVEVLTIESDKTPFDLGAWSSRGTYYSGNAGRKTAQAVAERLKALAARHLGNGVIHLEGGNAVYDGRTVSFGDLAREAPESKDGVLTTELSFVEGAVHRADANFYGNLSGTYSFAAHAAEIDVDRRTGKLRVVDYVAAHDVGKAINPRFVDGQIVGGAVMGMGSALGEEMIYEQGRLVTASFINYAMPRAADLPEIRSIIIEGGDPKGPHGAKGVGELCITPPAPAIANALYDALGIRVADLPITPDKILTALALREGRVRQHFLWRRPNLWWTAFVRWCYPRGLFALLHRWGPVLRRPKAPPSPEADIACPNGLADALTAMQSGASAIGGGTDLLPRIEDHLAAPALLVSTLDVDEMQRVAFADDGSVSIGAAVTLADLADALGGRCAAIEQTIASIANTQIRQMATVAGNLLQEKRCWFYRNDFDCYKRSGPARPCYAVLGDHRFYHAVIDGHRCQAVTPSDLVTSLAALDATVTIAGPAGSRTIDVLSLYTGPGETSLKPDEVIVRVGLPGAALKRRGSFQKLNLWEGDFAVASVAMTAHIDANGQWTDYRMIFGALAPTPWRARMAEGALAGNGPPAIEDLQRALNLELNAAAYPLVGNAWKLDAALGLAEQAFEVLLTTDATEKPGSAAAGN